MANYKALVGLEYNDKRVEEGETASDIPAKSVSWLLEQGLIELVETSSKIKKNEPVVVVEEEVI